ncbi:hypothetical protein [Bacillus sp. CECT 9360]|nr:hypothetical protein [Bacillus sp. CECT 9360]CAH0345228.1 hypothetical protein BCI9360_01508 [Bacillus sp. CECT 9360]
MNDEKSKIKYDARGNVIPSNEKQNKAELDSKRGILDEKNPDDFE